MVTKKPLAPLIVIVGETASGKSDAAMKIAQKFNGEIVVADSWTVYKGFDVGTAKPSTSDQAKIKHHLIDVADPSKGFNAAQFKKMATEAIDDITRRSKLPILVGGTGLYIDSILFDFTFLPAGPLAMRRKYNAMTVESLLELIEQMKIDASGIDIRNKRRLVRLIENQGVRPSHSSLRQDTFVVGLKISKEDLTTNITKRVNKMIRGGLTREVSYLNSKYGWDVEPMKGIGYREFKDYIKGDKKLAEVKQEIIKNTLSLAKKQRTWFKRNNNIKWAVNSGEIVDFTTIFLNKF